MLVSELEIKGLKLAHSAWTAKMNFIHSLCLQWGQAAR
jgi:hypothetical protein